MAYVTVWKQDFRDSERLPAEAVQVLYEQGVIRTAFKPNNKGKLKPVFVSLDVISKIRDLSCQMGPEVTLRAVGGSRHHMAIVEAWAH